MCVCRCLVVRASGSAAGDGKERKLLLDWVTYLLAQCLEAGPALEPVQVRLT